MVLGKLFDIRDLIYWLASLLLGFGVMFPHMFPAVAERDPDGQVASLFTIMGVALIVGSKRIAGLLESHRPEPHHGHRDETGYFNYEDSASGAVIFAPASTALFGILAIRTWNLSWYSVPVNPIWFVFQMLLASIIAGGLVYLIRYLDKRALALRPRYLAAADRIQLRLIHIPFSIKPVPLRIPIGLLTTLIGLLASPYAHTMLVFGIFGAVIASGLAWLVNL